MTTTLPPLRDVIKKHGLWAEKKFGQNFITDLNITRRIAAQAGSLENTHVVEIGPGPGGLTRSILELTPTKLTAIELDPRCIEALTDVQSLYPNLEIRQQDALQLDMNDLGQDLIVIANLPYNISTALLLNWLETHGTFKCLVLMFQKEVAQRLTAFPRTKSYGRLSVMTQWLMNVETCFDLPPSVFTPPPKITSTVVKLTPKKITPSNEEFRVLEKVTTAAFGQRRKMLRSSLKTLDISPLDLLQASNIEETKRAEELSIDDFLRLAKAYQTLSTRA